MAQTENSAQAEAVNMTEAAQQAQTETTAATATENQQPTQTYTLDELTRLIQSEADKRVTQALAKQRKEYEKKLSLSSLSEQERAAAEKEQQIADLQEQLKELRGFKVRSAVLGELSKRGIPAEAADVIELDADDDEKNLARINALEKIIKDGVEAGVKARLSGKAPSAGTAAAKLTREAYLKMSLAQQQQLAQTDPETYKAMNT